MPSTDAQPPQTSGAPHDFGANGSVPILKLWGIRWTIAAAVSVALISVAGLLAAALWYAGFPGLEQIETVTASTLFDLLKLVFAVVAGVGGVAALVVAYRKQRVAEHANRLSEYAQELARAADARADASKALAEHADQRAETEHHRNGIRLLNERFSTTADQLGSDKAAIRLAGVYAMAGLADDWREGRQTCIDVLCAYMRLPYSPPGMTVATVSGEANDQRVLANDADLNSKQEREVRHTVLRLIGDHLRRIEGDPFSWSGYEFDFTGAVIDGGNFAGAEFKGGRVSFERATFVLGEFSLAGATFDTTLASFAGAKFEGAGVSFKAASFTNSELDFESCEVSAGELDFRDIKLNGGRLSLRSSNLTGGTVDFHRAVLEDGELDFSESTIRGAGVHFHRAQFRCDTRFDRIEVDNGEVTFTQAVFAKALISFSQSKLRAGLVSFGGASFEGSDVSFSGTQFHGAAVSFTSASLTAGSMNFWSTNFNRVDVSFGGTTFQGGIFIFKAAQVGAEATVDFHGSRFIGTSALFAHLRIQDGRIAMAGARFEIPPIFSFESRLGLPRGLELPKNLRLNRDGSAQEVGLDASQELALKEWRPTNLAKDRQPGKSGHHPNQPRD
ncbi:pentapeptide repeat-containing protein [Micromonospora aurantiaca (nom. illeg.)]|uniref:pentapeptide repeat-containing protein n=1 Tax=Micromonospora aurantiaca (nom. illeg.) TaxID=47850 RepID=UPI0036983745